MAFLSIYLAVVVSLTCSKCELLLQTEETSSKITFRCLNQLAGMFRPANSQAILTNFEGFLYKEAPLVRVSNRGTVKCFKTCPEVGAYILDFQRVNISELLRNLELNHICNPHSFFIARISSVENVNFSLFAQKYIEKVLLVDAKRDIHTYHPYKYENLREPDLQTHKYGSCEELHLISENDFFMSKPKYWRNSTLSAVLRMNPPYVTGNGTGLEELMLKYIENILKTRITFEYVEFGSTAAPYMNEKRAVREHKRDIFGGHIVLSDEDVGDFEISPPYLNDKLVFISPKPLNVYLWRRVFQLFPNNFWVLLSIAMCTSSLLTKKFYNICFFQSFLVYAQILAGVPLAPARTGQTSRRALFGAWFLFFTILSTLFKNVLIFMSATTLKSKGIDTIEDVVKSDLPIYSMLNLSNYFTSPEEQQLLDWRTVHKCSNYLFCTENVAMNQNSISVGSMGIFSTYVIPSTYNKDSEVMLHMSKNAIIEFPLYLLCTKGHPIYDQLSRIIQRHVNNGWLRQEMRIQNHLMFLKNFRKYTVENRTIFLGDLSYSFSLWAGGCVVSVVAFFGEYVIWHLKRKIKVNVAPVRKSVPI